MTSQRASNQDRPHTHLSRLERQIMDALYASEEASAAEVQSRIPSPPSYSAVRALLGKLVEKGHVDFRREGTRYLYRATLDKSVAQRNAWQRLLNTFFSGSTADAVVSLLGREGELLSADELDAIEHKVAELKARKNPRSWSGHAGNSSNNRGGR
jgi:predicted transcriptional regulator